MSEKDSKITLTILKPRHDPEFRVDVYRVDKSQEKKETLKQIIKESIFYSLIVLPWQREIDEWLDRNKTGLMANLAIDPKPAFSILFKGEAAYLPRIYIRGKPKEPLNQFFSQIHEEFIREHSMFKREMVEDFLLERADWNLNQFTAVRNDAKNKAFRWESLLWMVRKAKAEAMLQLKFGHPDINESVRRLAPFRETLEGRESLWLEAMLYLKNEGLNYYVAKRASDQLAFLEGYDTDHNPDDCYIYRDREHYQIKHHLESIKPLGHSEIVKWRNENAELNKRVYEFDKLQWEETQQRKQLLRELKPILASWIHQGFTREYVVDQCRKAGYATSLIQDTLELWERLLGEGVKPDKTIKITIIPKEPEKHESQVDLDSEWIDCMAHHSGAPGLDGHSNEPDPFDQATSSCTNVVFRMSGMQPSKDAFEKVKKFWEVGYWVNHEISKGEIFIRTEQSKIQTIDWKRD